MAADAADCWVEDAAPTPAVDAAVAPRTLTQCHDITVHPAVGLAGGACAGMGLLLDIHDTPHPTRLTAVADSNFSFLALGHVQQRRFAGALLRRVGRRRRRRSWRIAWRIADL